MIIITFQYLLSKIYLFTISIFCCFYLYFYQFLQFHYILLCSAYTLYIYMLTCLISRMILSVYSSISMTQLSPDIPIQHAGSYFFLLMKTTIFLQHINIAYSSAATTCYTLRWFPQNQGVN